jgi:hypothetical protein
MTNKILFIADVYVNELPGGAELVNDELISLLEIGGFEVVKAIAREITPDVLNFYRDTPIILGSFVSMREDTKNELASGKYKYVIYEHDHKYLPLRNPALFQNFEAPKNGIVNRALYENARMVACQTAMHEDIINRNLKLSNTNNLSSSLWGNNFLDAVLDIPVDKPRKFAAVIASTNPVKNQAGAEGFCKQKNYDYEVISEPTPIELAKRLSQFDKLVFFPTVPESLGRTAVEAKMVGCGIITNNLLAVTKEPWFNLPRQELVQYLRDSRQKTVDVFLGAFE